jgi:hypothetical protein
MKLTILVATVAVVWVLYLGPRRMPRSRLET